MQLVSWWIERLGLYRKGVFNVVVVVVIIVTGLSTISVVVAKTRVSGRRLHAIVGACWIANFVRLRSFNISPKTYINTKLTRNGI